MATNFSPINSLNIASYNQHGFNSGLNKLAELCNSHHIIAIQEHWLSNHNLDKLNSMNNNFNVFGVSGMNSMLSFSLLRGRPFGGVAFLWHKCLASHISYVCADVEGRCTATRLNINCRVIILFAVYFPCLSTKASYKTDLSQCLDSFDSVISVRVAPMQS